MLAVAGVEGMKPLSPKIASRPLRRDCYGPGTPTDAPPYCSLSEAPTPRYRWPAENGRHRVSHCNAFGMTGLPIQGPPGGRWASGRPQCSRLRNRFPRSPATVEPLRRSLMSPLQGGGRNEHRKATDSFAVPLNSFAKLFLRIWRQMSCHDSLVVSCLAKV